MSKDRPSADIPLETSCPYNPKSEKNNETQIPLGNKCYSGKVKVVDFKKLQTIDDIYAALDSNQPVVSAFKLSSNFYKNKGFVSLADPTNKEFEKNPHSKGHSILLIGYMKLPKHLHQREGKICFITANSWGMGWGRGGHACLSERWVQRYRYKIPFLAIQKIKRS